MSESIRKRIYCFDLLKIISIFTVFMHHIMMDMYVVHPMSDLRVLESIILRPNMNLGMIACGLFVLISGATISLSKREEGLISFYKRRLTRVLIPFYISYIIYFIIRVITFKTIHMFGGIAKWRFIYTIIGMDEYLNANGIQTFSLGIGEWFLGCIILCYLLYPLLKKAHKKSPIITFIVITIYFAFINIRYNSFNFVIPSHMNFFCQIYNFYLGMVLIDEKILSKLKKQLCFITVPVILFFFFYNIYIPIPDNFKTTIVIVCIFLTFYLFENAIANVSFFRWFVPYFNKISLEIFLVHHFVIYQVDYLLGYRKVTGIETLLIVLFDLVVIIIFAILVEKLSEWVYRLMDKCKAQRV